MNREEFKYIIIQQMKNVGGPIYSLLYKGRTSRSNSEQRFHALRQFYSRDLNIVANIIRVEDEGSRSFANFDVTFQPLDHPGSAIEHESLPIDGTISFAPTCEESIIFGGQFLDFYLVDYGVEVHDYAFRINSLNKVPIARYDIINGVFVWSPDPETSINEFKVYARSGSRIYVYLWPDESLYTEMINQLQFIGVPNERINAVINALSSFKHGINNLTAMMAAMCFLDPSLTKYFKD